MSASDPSGMRLCKCQVPPAINVAVWSDWAVTSEAVSTALKVAAKSTQVRLLIGFLKGNIGGCSDEASLLLPELDVNLGPRRCCSSGQQFPNTGRGSSN